MTEPIIPKKHSAMIKLSPILAEVYTTQLAAMLNNDTVLFNKLKDDADHDALIKEYREKAEKERKELLETLSKATGTHKAILELHSENNYGECSGCDLGSYAESGAEWPCRTVDLIAEEIRGKD